MPTDDGPAKARKLVKKLQDVTEIAEELAATVASGIRKERAAGLPYKSSSTATAKRKPKRKRKHTASKKR